MDDTFVDPKKEQDVSLDSDISFDVGCSVVP